MPSSNYPTLSLSHTKSLLAHLHSRPPPDNYWGSVYLALARSHSGTSPSRFLLKEQWSTCQSRNLFRTTYQSSRRGLSLPSGTDHLLLGRLEDPRRVLALSRSTSPSRCQSKAQLTRCPERRFRTRCLSFHRC